LRLEGGIILIHEPGAFKVKTSQMKLLTLFCLCFATSLCFSQEQLFSIFFENQEYTIDKTDETVIDQCVAFVSGEQRVIQSIIIQGYTDEKATEDYNLILSKNRATSVQQSVIKKLPVSLQNKVSIQWFGETIPAEKKSGYHYGHRSVDIIILYETITIEPAQSVENISVLMDKLATPPQYFTIDPKRDTVIYGREGTIIQIPADAFNIPENAYNQTVEIILQESYTISDMLLNNLTTVSNNEQLETDGMLYVNAKVGSRLVKLKDDKSLRIMIPTKNPVAGMQFFRGAHDINGNMDWSLTRDPLTAIYGIQINQLLNPSMFTKKAYKKNCPYLFCGMRNDLGLITPKYTERKEYNRTDWKAYRAYIDSMCLAYNVTSSYELKKLFTARAIREAETNYYIVEASGLGFMNCDRFLNLPDDQKVLVRINQKQQENITAYMVFKSFKSILSSNYADSEHIGFTNVGKGNKCFVVLIKYENKNPFLSITEINIAENTLVTPEYKQVSETELKTALAGLNS
jgi:hypothetical protein